jgi:hypothetical protein
MVKIQPTVSTDAPKLPAPSSPLFRPARARWPSQRGPHDNRPAIWWPFDQRGGIRVDMRPPFLGWLLPTFA